MIIHFLTIDPDDRMILCAAEITDVDRERGFFIDHGYIPPYCMFDTEEEALQVLRRHAAEVGVEVQSLLH